MDWLHPTYWWTLAAVPLAVGLFWWAARQREAALRQMGRRSLIRRLTAAVRPRRRRWKAALATAALLFLSLALLGPRFGTETREVERTGIDLVIALDVSRSMLAEDVAPNRLERAKNEIKELLDALRGDRVGLVIFAGEAFLQCPLTTDYGAVRLFLDVAVPDQMGTPGTNFGAAFRTALRALDVPEEDAAAPPAEAEDRARAVLFVSDGENHAEGIDAILQEARASEVTLFAAGIGSVQGAPIPLYDGARRTGYHRDRQGRVVTTRLEETVLTDLSQDGAYFRIASTSSALSSLPAALERLQQAPFATEAFESYRERYQWPLALALVLLVAERLVRDRRTAPANESSRKG